MLYPINLLHMKLFRLSVFVLVARVNKQVYPPPPTPKGCQISQFSGCRHSSTYVSYILEGPEQVRTEYIYGQMRKYIRVSPAENQTPTHWSLTHHSITAPPPMLLPSSILLPPLSYCALIPTREKS